MSLGFEQHTGLALGAWGAVNATATGLAVFSGGALRDLFSMLSSQGVVDPLFDDAVSAYGAVYHLEILLLFLALVALGPVARTRPLNEEQHRSFDLADFPA